MYTPRYEGHKSVEILRNWFKNLGKKKTNKK